MIDQIMQILGWSGIIILLSLLTLGVIFSLVSYVLKFSGYSKDPKFYLLNGIFTSIITLGILVVLFAVVNPATDKMSSPKYFKIIFSFGYIWIAYTGIFVARYSFKQYRQLKTELFTKAPDSKQN